MLKWLCITCSCFLILSACAPFKPTDHRAAMCNELNSQIIFNGGTSITRHSEIQAAEEPLLQRSFDRDGCS